MDLHLACFRFDVSPPLGHALCGGWITPVTAIDDPLEAIGFVLLGAGAPLVICAVDWTGILNSAHLAWRTALADAAHTTPERVAVQCVHQHDAPFACLDTTRIVAPFPELPPVVQPAFHEKCLEAGAKAVREALAKTRRITGVATGQAKVEKVASNRRILGPNGKVIHQRSSATADPKLRELPEGLIDPYLKTIAFYDGEDKVASLHFYASHPMSYYGQGRVNSEFVGMARKRRQKEEPGCLHVYFTGASGNIAAGKYNDGSKENRPRLAERMHAGIVASEANLRPAPIASVEWRVTEILPPPRTTTNAADIEANVANQDNPIVGRNRPAYELAWKRRVERKEPMIVGCLDVNEASMITLPAESFIEYQLRAQSARPDRFVATAAYGDGGPWYIPVAEAYPQGGYEVSVAFSDPAIDDELTAAIRKVLKAGA